MKPFLVIVTSTTIILLILGAVFRQQIFDTIHYYQYQHDNKNLFVQATLTWKQIPFTSSGSSGRASDSLLFNSLQLPVPYGATKSVGKNAAMAVGYTELITVTHSSAAADFFRMYNFSDEEKTSTCAFLSQTSGRGACSSNYEFYRTFLELNETDLHLFSSSLHKELYNRVMSIRAEAIPSNVVSAFETSRLRGFLFTIDTEEFIAEIFTANDTQYHLEFSGLTQADVAIVLSHTTVQ